MRIAIIGRSELLFETMLKLREAGHEIACILTAKEAPEYTKTSQDYKEYSESHQVPFAQNGNIIKHSSFLSESKADIAVSINYTGVVPQSIIDLFPLGVLNAHGGDLPRYRGNACQAWAILNGEDRIGLCIHKMVGGELDSGNIITRDYLSIDHTTKVTIVWDWMKERIPDLMLDAVNKLQVDPVFYLEEQSKDPKNALRCYPRKPEDGRINWEKPAVGVLRLINASTKPYAGAYCSFENEKLIIWDAELVDDGEIFCAVPGQVTKIGDSFIEVACGSGKLRFYSFEINGEINEANSIIKSIRTRLC